MEFRPGDSLLFTGGLTRDDVRVVDPLDGNLRVIWDHGSVVLESAGGDSVSMVFLV